MISVDQKAQENVAVPQVYANLSQVAASVSDISITLGMAGTVPLGAEETNPAITVAVIRLSPPAAKMLLLNLEQIVKVYEMRFSEIHVPKEFEDALRHGNASLGITNKDGAS